MDVKLLKKEKKSFIKNEEKDPWLEWREWLFAIVITVAEIPLENKKDSKKIIPLMDDDRNNNDDDHRGSQNLSSSKINGLNDATGADMEAGNNQIDEDFVFVDDDIWNKLVNPWTLFFRSPKREDAYFRTVLLPTRVLLMRLTSSVLIILLIVNIGIISTSAFSSTVWIVSIILAGLFGSLTWYEHGRNYIDLTLESTYHRIAVMFAEISMFTVVSLFDFGIGGRVSADVGPMSFIVASYFSICCGLTASYLETTISLSMIAILCIVKLIILSETHPTDSILACVVYGIPCLMGAISNWGLVFPNDELRRLRFLKSLCIDTQLAQMKQERLKTDYLLSLSLPKSIVAKLRDQSNFGLIVEKFPRSCVMFGDMKNFKDVAHMISMREAVILLNGVFEHIDDMLTLYPTLEKIKTISSKILIVGGINSAGDRFLQDMTDLALNLLDYFSEPKEYDVDNEMIQVKLSMGFGIAWGPIVAGIVGKKKFVYEIYGDVVNTCKLFNVLNYDKANIITASRMCSLAKGSDIIVTEKCYEICKDEYSSVYLGDKYVKGKGEIPVYQITGTNDTQAFEERKYASADLLSTKTSKSKNQSFYFGDIVKYMSDEIFSCRTSSSNHDETEQTHGHFEEASKEPISGSRTTSFQNQSSGKLKSQLSYYSQDSSSSGNKLVTGSCDRIGDKRIYNKRNEPRHPPADDKLDSSFNGQLESHRGDFSTVRRQSLVPQTIIDIAKNNYATPRSPLNTMSSSTMESDSEEESENVSLNSKSASLKISPVMSPEASSLNVVNVMKSVSQSYNHIAAASAAEGKKSEKDKGPYLNNALKSASNNNPKVDDEKVKDDKDKKKKTKVDSDEAKEVVVDVIMRMIKKVNSRGKKTSEKYIREISKEMEDFSLRFKHKSLEEQFRLDFNAATSWPFLRSTLQILVLEMLMVFLAVFNANRTGNDLLLVNKSVFNVVLGAVAGTTGLQLLICGVSVFASMEEEPSTELAPRMIHYGSSVLTLVIIAIIMTLPWSFLYTYNFMVGGVIPQLVIFIIMRTDGVLFIYKLFTALIAAAGLVIYQHALNHTEWYISVSVIILIVIWASAFHRGERNTRIEYLIDAIMETQAELVSKEILKSANVLHSILPQLVIDKLLSEPNSIVYEDFTIMTVLHLDIAGFTAMSSTLEPSVILEMLNTLFSYFDHLTEEFNVEKITTIGDAYVACSSFNPNANPKTGAISICLVGLQMQSYLSHQLNESEFVKKNVRANVKMRVGVHTGPAVGAIMGGPRNFRYDLLGDTVLYAEKVQEIAPVGYVNISETAYEQVKDYHGFGFTKNKEQTSNGMDTYVLKGFDDRLVAHGSDFDLNAPLKSQRAVQETDKVATSSKGTGRRTSNMNQVVGVTTSSTATKRPTTGARASLAAPGYVLARNNSFGGLNASGSAPSH